MHEAFRRTVRGNFRAIPRILPDLYIVHWLDEIKSHEYVAGEISLLAIAAQQVRSQTHENGDYALLEEMSVKRRIIKTGIALELQCKMAN